MRKRIRPRWRQRRQKARDELHNRIQQIEEQLQPKRARIDDDAGDAHEKLAEVDNWDLRDHRQ
jgi:hypothetical protein